MRGRTIAIIVFAVGATATLLTLGCCGSFLYWGYTSASQNISPQVEELLARIEAGTFAETYDTETTAAFRSVTTREQYADIGSAVKNRLGPLQSLSMQSYNARQMNAESSIDATYAGKFAEGDATIDVRFVREGEAWKIEHLRVNSPLFAQEWATGNCPHCGAPHAKDARFCPACGKELPAPISDDAGDDPGP